MLVETAAVTLDSRVKPENDGGVTTTAFPDSDLSAYVTGVLIAVGFAL